MNPIVGEIKVIGIAATRGCSLNSVPGGLNVHVLPFEDIAALLGSNNANLSALNEILPWDHLDSPKVPARKEKLSKFLNDHYMFRKSCPKDKTGKIIDSEMEGGVFAFNCIKRDLLAINSRQGYQLSMTMAKDIPLVDIKGLQSFSGPMAACGPSLF